MGTEIFNKLCDIERALERIADALEKQNIGVSMQFDGNRIIPCLNQESYD